jgi:hypothetical protein
MEGKKRKGKAANQARKQLVMLICNIQLPNDPLEHQQLLLSTVRAMGCEVHERGHHAGAHCKGVDGGPRGGHGRGQADAAAAADPLGELPRGPLRPPCAPRGVSHAAFYGELDRAAAPACHLVAGDYGHPNMMHGRRHAGRQGDRICFDTPWGC